MPNLYNPLPYPVGTRRCFWDAEYIAAEPFCVTSNLTAGELISLAAFEEMKFWERTEQLKIALSAQANNELVETLDELLNDDRGIDFDAVFSAFEKAPKKYRFVGMKNGKVSLGSCNTQTSSGLPEKSTLKRSDYLNR